MTPTAVLDLAAVTRTHVRGGSEVRALRGVTLSIAEGELVAIMGPSGSGKSTLLHLMGGLDRPSSGTVTLRGRDLGRLSRRQLAGVRSTDVGFVFQAFNLVPGLTAADNVALPAMLAGHRPAAARARAADLLDRVGLGDEAGAHPAQLSGGQQQRVAVARALVMEPSVVLADEPTGNLDTRSGQEVLDLLAGARRPDRTVVLVTHDPRIAARADRIVYLRDGLVVDEVSPAVADRLAPPAPGRLVEVGEGEPPARRLRRASPPS